MSPVLPSSLSPHVCLLPSQDLVHLLQNASLPPLRDILQSFSPLPNITTRTTSLTTASHPSFTLRFSDLADTERACLEDDGKRAARTIDWIGERITKQCPLWLKEFEENSDRYATRTPWWDELVRCAEGDHIPSKHDGWNHPVSIILAVSTTSPNPLQAITALHARAMEFPPWVDTTHLLYTLIVHPQDSPLSDEEAAALFNAVKKQFGLHAFILHLSLPRPPPPPVPVPPLPPRLPPSSSETWQNGFPPPQPDSSSPVGSPNLLKLSEPDIQQVARFTREFVVMSLLPWMERCVIEWNEAYSSSRRLPSRLFSSTRKFFGSSTQPAQYPTHAPSPSVSSLQSRSHTSQPVSSTAVLPAPPSQLRRLAEFATILGDYKLATGVWESLRKENKGGSDILPLLLSPSSAIPAHAAHALSTIFQSGSDMSPQVQVHALKCAVRWEVGISLSDFTGDLLEGDRWLVWAAGSAEEPPAALLLAHAAFLSSQKNAKRRAALWYLFAANRLEKCGIKPLTMFFLRKAHELFSNRPKKSLSPSFWNSQESSSELIGFDAVLSGIEHPLGRLLYTIGDIEGAVRFFLGQLRWSSSSFPPRIDHEDGEEGKETSSDKVLLEDFRVAFSHLKSISGRDVEVRDLKLPITFVSPALSRVRLPRDSTSGDRAEWQRKEEIWRTFWRTRGKETLEKSGRAAVGEPFWIDVALQNPLDTEVTLTNLALVVGAKDQETLWINQHVIVEPVKEVVLRSKESRTVSVAVKVSQAASLTVHSITYDFLDLLPTTESLAQRGRRLQDTPQQRQTVTYAPDILIRTDVEEASQELAISFKGDGLLVLNEGEHPSMKLWMSNVGHKAIGEAWLVGGPEDQIWLEPLKSEPLSVAAESFEILHTDNKLRAWTPFSVPLPKELRSGDSTVITLTWRPGLVASGQLCLLFVYRESGGHTFHCTHVTRPYQVNPSIELSATSTPSPSIDNTFIINLEVSNVSLTPMRIRQVTAVSPAWECHHITQVSSISLQPAQLINMSFNASPLDSSATIEATTSFVLKTLGNVLNGRKIESSDPPTLNLVCHHISNSDSYISVHDPALSCLFLSEKEKITANLIARSHPFIPSTTYPHIFPLFNPLAVDFLVFWEIPSEQRTGFVLLAGLNLGAGHAALQEVIEDVEGAKVKRSMYAETQREKMEILRSIRDSEWNVEMNPVVVTVEEDVVQHDFSRGFCLAPVKFSLRNHSLSHPSRFVVKFGAISEDQFEQSELLPPRYTGRLTIRGLLQPLQSTIVETKLWASRPGTYALSGWQVESIVGEPNQSAWRTRHHYVQGPPLDHHPRMIVTDVR